MTLFLRRISEAKSWRELERNPPQGDHIPNWFLREFLPVPRDKDILSVYEVPEDDDTVLHRLASALLVTWNSEHFLFLAAKRDTFENAGIAISDDKGGTFDLEVNGWHRGLKIENVDQAQIVAKLFLGEIKAFRFSREESLNAAGHHAAIGHIDLMQAWKKKPDPRAVVVQLIDNNAAQIVPQPAYKRTASTKG